MLMKRKLSSRISTLALPLAHLTQTKHIKYNMNVLCLMDKKVARRELLINRCISACIRWIYMALAQLSTDMKEITINYNCRKVIWLKVPQKHALTLFLIKYCREHDSGNSLHRQNPFIYSISPTFKINTSFWDRLGRIHHLKKKEWSALHNQVREMGYVWRTFYKEHNV
jgi:hypothetical protein